MAQPRKPPELIDDAIGEILLRIPPGESVCKLWRRILSDPDFTRRYRAFHRTPPLLGFLYNSDVDGLFYPTMASCPFPQSAFDCSRWLTLDDRRRLWAVDCRHGRVLLLNRDTRNLVVWDPITGGKEELPKPHIPNTFYSGVMVLCAAAGCDHRNCLGGPFLVVFVGTEGRSVLAFVYSSKARAWGMPVSVNIGNGGYYFFDSAKRGALVGDNAYFTLRKLVFGDHDEFTLRKGTKIMKYDLGKNFLSVIDMGRERDAFLIPMEDGSLGFADIRDSTLYLWRWRVAGWVPCRVINLEKLLPSNISCNNQANLVGFAEGVGVAFVRIDTSLFMIELKSEPVRKVCEVRRFYTILAFMSFYTPGTVPPY
ncbi:hypothetical protein C2845_PM18G03800 [Panicum miliaceum]|uniref:F-box domain-containing protein n=1 Tax=Panicum miliaceum TaxID=4540 RepID=A0A3L6PJP9_PANMI|nr:hypothetical protein C2845_PM18G03800 [Panicum miliaceum]